MDPDRVRAYLQVACTGLGFDIGEVWWTSNDNGSSTVAAIEGKTENSVAVVSPGRHFRFVQLYTSRSYEDRRAMLVKPDKDDDGVCEESELQKHVLSPQLVNAISSTAQVLWANCQKQEGLLGRSDVRLQTAVGMPVAVDSKGNMCVVVMFSPNIIRNTEDAMEYLQFISRSATSSSIPSLLPVFDSSTDPRTPPLRPPHSHQRQLPPITLSISPGEGVTANFVSLDDGSLATDPMLEHNHDLTAAPKDCFGIPMLPAVAELEGTVTEENPAGSAAPISDAFDDASFGIWSTIMSTTADDAAPSERSPSPSASERLLRTPSISRASSVSSEFSTTSSVLMMNKPIMPPHQRERLGEFASAFLGISVFDAADVWIPRGGSSRDMLCHVISVSSTSTNDALNGFKTISESATIKAWSGAVGRAYASGNPVWSANQDVIVDTERATAFALTKIQTALAVPIFSAGSASPVCVLCCYSLVRTDAVPFVLRFVQQALRLLWAGLDRIEPHQSVGKDIWREVAPADLGEMAADLEMHQEFLRKKRPHSRISPPENHERKNSFSLQLDALSLPGDGSQALNSYVGMNEEAAASPRLSTIQQAPQVVNLQTKPSIPLTGYAPLGAIQNHLQSASQSVGTSIPFTSHQHVATTNDGSKRAHVLVQNTTPAPIPTPQPYPTIGQSQHHFQQPTQPQNEPTETAQINFAQNHHPLQMPQALPNHFISQPLAKNPQFQTTYNLAPLFDPGTASSANENNFGQFSTLPQHTNNQTPLVGMPQHGSQIPLSTQAQNAASMPLGASGPVRNFSMGAQPGSLGVPNGSSAATSTPPQFCLPTASTNAVPVQQTNTGGKACRIQGCDEPAVARRPYCLRHSGNRLCEHPGCTKCAQGSTRFCIAHGGGRRCTFPGCDKGARDKYFCAAHGGGKRCTAPGCNKSAVGGSNLCTSHGGGRRCSVEGCDKSAQSSTKFCVKHGGGKKCAHAGCEKVARGRTMYCAAHGGGVRCKLEGCNRVAIGKLQLCRAHGGGARSRPKATSQNNNNTALQPPIPLPSATSHAQHVAGV